MVTLEVNENSKQAKAFLELVKTFDFVTFVEPKLKKDTGAVKEQDLYNPEFVSKVLNSYKNDKRTAIKSADLWESK